jgi:cyclophilin family peptidyl-prolyl cis-trans isomerase
MRDKLITIVAVVAVIVGFWALNRYSRTGDRHLPDLTREFKAEANAETEGAKNMTAEIETNMGTFSFELYPDVAPQTVASFVKLAKEGFYDGLIFHRIIDGFMIQGGDPTGTGTGGPGYTIKAEFSDKKHVAGTVSMARSANPDSAGSQFFVCLAPASHLDGQYTVFGQVVDGMDVVSAIGKVKTGPQDRPVEDVVMKKVTIQESDADD